MTTIYVVRPNDPAEDLAAFIHEQDAERFAATFDQNNVGDVENVVVADAALAAAMIAERIEDEDPGDENGLSMEPRYTVSDILARFRIMDRGDYTLHHPFRTRNEAQQEADRLNSIDSPTGRTS